MRRAHRLWRFTTFVLIAGFVIVGIAAQAAAHLLTFTPPPGESGEVGDSVGELSSLAEPGPYPVGIRPLTERPDPTGSAPGESTSSPAEPTSPDAVMWYPAGLSDDSDGVTYAYGVRLIGSGTETALATYDGRAVIGAPFLDSGAAGPLVILSHGFALTAESYGWLAEHLASHGMVVVAPDHAETLDPGRLWEATIERPRTVRKILADLEVRSAPGGDLHGVIDLSRIGVIGHSYGGYTALAAGGAELDLGSFQTSCAEARVTDDPITFLCDALEPRVSEIAAAAPPPDLPSGVDIDAVVSIAGDAAMFGESGLAHLTAPVMVIGGTADVDTPYAWGPALTYAHTSSERRAEVTLEGAAHLVFAGRCDVRRRILTLADLGFCSDPSWDRDAAHAVVKHHATAFLRSELLGDDEATSALVEAPPLSNVGYRTTGY